MNLTPNTAQLRQTRLSELLPYTDNPRIIPPEAIQAVAFSIKKYGYQQPIVANKDKVVIAGHTRLLALQSLGITTATVAFVDLSDEEAQELRLADNAAGEKSSWDFDALDLELKHSDAGLQELFIGLDEEMARARRERDNEKPDWLEDTDDEVVTPDQGEVTLTCSSCNYQWSQIISADDVASGFLPSAGGDHAER